MLTIYPKRPSIHPGRLSIADMIKRLNELPGPGSVQKRDIIEPPERERF